MVALGKVIRSLDNGFAVSIEAGCNGVEAMIVLAAAIFAFPVPWKRKIAGFAQHGNRVEVATHFDISLLQAGPAPDSGTIAFDMNPLIYGYGLPLLTGLILASPGDLEGKIFRIFAGGVVLLPIQAWGVSFDVLKTLYFNFGQEVTQAARGAAAYRRMRSRSPTSSDS